jgi:hypothetical protein
MTPPAILELCRGRGIAVSAADGKLKLRGPADAIDTELKAALAAHKAALLLLVSPLEKWGATLARRLMFEADGLVEQLGVNGHDPRIARLAAVAVDAQMRHDLRGVRAAVEEFTRTARTVAEEHSPGGTFRW